MAFSSNFFLFAFLPAVLVLYFASPASQRNLVLLVVSLLFYAFDVGALIWLLIASIVLNHAVAVALPRLEGRSRHLVFAAAVAANLAFLLHYKYTGFLWGALGQTGLPLGAPPAIELPIGISFFTFQAISYIADVYTRRTVPARRLIDFGAYHSLFPQLIAGPIVRYVEVEWELYDHHRHSLDKFSDGLYRFCIGFAKKIIVADQMGVVADAVFRLPHNELTFAVAWVGVLCYAMQIYYDFSGYSDMAIGLGLMLGFRFPENFNQPYRARSITEFWRRWHMTLSRWFRDYLYIPLGGSRRGPWRTYANLFVVFFLCGLWHGAGYTFIVWGLYHGALLAAERLYMNRIGPLPRGPLMWLLTFLLVTIGWVFFRSADMAQAVAFLKAMFWLSSPTAQYYGAAAFATPHKLFFFAVALTFALVPFERMPMRLGDTKAQAAVCGTGAVLLFIYATALLATNSFNAFIYFRF